MNKKARGVEVLHGGADTQPRGIVAYGRSMSEQVHLSKGLWPTDEEMPELAPPQGTAAHG